MSVNARAAAACCQWRALLPGACSGTGVRGCKGMPRAHLELRKTITNGALSGRERSLLRRACSCLRSTVVGL